MSGLKLTWLKEGRRDRQSTPLLAVVDLCVRVGVRRVLENLNLEVYSGDHVRITGPNGCGKSTLLNAIAGVEPARIEAGRIAFGGRDISPLPAHERSALGIAYMRQTDNVFPSLTVREHLVLALGQDGYSRFASAFPEWAKDLPHHKRAGQLSGGQRKRLAWAYCVLRLGAPSWLFLADEPSAGVSESFSFERVTTCLLVTHDHTRGSMAEINP